jgi:hypothetical protein
LDSAQSRKAGRLRVGESFAQYMFPVATITGT